MALALAGTDSRANYGGRLGLAFEEAVAATRVALPDATQPPTRLPPAAVPVGAISPVTPDLAASIPPAPIPPTPALATAAVPTGPLLAIPAPGTMARIPPPAIATPPTPALAIAMVPKGPLLAIPGPGGSAIGVPPPTRYAPFAIASPALPPLTRDFCILATDRLVREGLADGILDPLDPSWRPHLARILNDTEYSVEAESLFGTLLAGCAGQDDRARLATAEGWAREYESGRFSATIAFYAARRTFTSGNYDETVARCERLAAQYPETVDRAMLLLALAQAQGVDRSRALKTLREFRERHPESPAVSEALFMEAWIELQDLHNEEAAAILREIVAKTPHAPAAAKASQLLSSIEGIKEGTK